MLGYIVPLKAELKVRELEAYQAYYCGICMSVKSRYGNIPRLSLSYDSAFIALLLHGISEQKEHVETKRCIANPFKKRNIVYDVEAVDYAADLMLIMAYYKCLDDYNDDRSMKGLTGKTMLRSAVKRAEKNIPEKCLVARENIQTLSSLEKKGCTSIDPAAEPFAKIMEEFMNWEGLGEKKRLSYSKFGYHLGKWIFLIDAYDDIEIDAESNSYNPLIKQHGLDLSKETAKAFKERVKERTELNLHLYLSEMAKAYEEMGITRNKGLIENIIYFGLHRKTDEVLGNAGTEEKTAVKE